MNKATIGGGSLGVVVVFAWNGVFPEYPMTAEVGAAVPAAVAVVFGALGDMLDRI